MTGERVEVSPNNQPLEIPRDKRGRIRWSVLKQDPDQLYAVIREEAQAFLQRNPLSRTNLSREGRADLDNAIRTYYPGRMSALKKDLSLSSLQKPPNYWNADRVREEAYEFFQQEGSLTQRQLIARGRAYLSVQIGLQYPGKLRGLKKDFELKAGTKPRGYWTPEAIEQEALDILAKSGKLTHPQLNINGSYDLSSAIRVHYPGGISALQEKLGVKVRRYKYWTSETIEAEAGKFYQTYGAISYPLLETHNCRHLISAIEKNTPEA